MHIIITLFDIRVVPLEPKLQCIIQPLEQKAHSNPICTAGFYTGKENLSKPMKNAQNAQENYGIELNCFNTPQNLLFF